MSIDSPVARDSATLFSNNLGGSEDISTTKSQIWKHCSRNCLHTAGCLGRDRLSIIDDPDYYVVQKNLMHYARVGGSKI
jgi:hypothetical protein